MRAKPTLSAGLFLAGLCLALMLPACTTAGNDAQTVTEDNISQSASEESVQEAMQTDSADADICIGMTLYSLQNEYTIRVAQAALERADELGIQLKIYDGNYDAELQIAQVGRMLEDGVDGILLNPQDADKCVECVEMAYDRKIPVVSVNTRVNSDLIASYVGSDDREAGRMLMNGVLDEIGYSKNVVILEGPAGQSAQMERQEGIREVLQEREDVHIISVKTANWSRLEAESIMKKWMETFDEIDAVVAENDDMALGASDAIGDDRTDIVVAGIDGSQDAIRAVLDDRFTMTIYQNADMQGRTAVDCILHLINGEAIEAEYDIPLEKITQDNAERFLQSAK